MSSRELVVWQRLQTVTETLRREVGRGLQGDAALTPAEFTVLAHLVEAGGSARHSASARSMGWDSSRLAHQLGRLEKKGLVLRSTDVQGDGRGSTVFITETGRAAHRRAVGPHLRAARRWFADGLDEARLTALDDALSALEQHIALLAETAAEDEGRSAK